MKLTRILKKIGRPYLQGDDVREAQTLLEKFGFSSGDIDGRYGPLTKKSVKAIQKANKQKRDGKVGSITWGALHKTENEPSTETPIGRFLSWIIKQIGCLYVWGAQGQIMTESLIERRENSARNLKRALAKYFDHIKKRLSLIAYDCSGLIIKYLLDKGYISNDTKIGRASCRERV